MRRYRKPRKFREPSSIELAWMRLRASQSWRASRTILLPMCILYVIYAQTWGHEERRANMVSAAVSVRHSAEHLPQFMLQDLEIRGLPERIAAQVGEKIEIEFPISVFHVDHEVLHETLDGIREVEHFTITPQGGGNLVIEAQKAEPVAVWRTTEGYKLITQTGRRIADVFDPGEEPDLPVVSGDGANRAAHEIPFLHRMSQPIAKSMSGFIRVGERRWDVMMDSGLLIMLPQDDPLGALEKVVQWEEEHSITSRSITRIDMRLPEAPLFRTLPEEEAFLFIARD